MAERQETSVMVSIQEILRDAQSREEQEKLEAEQRSREAEQRRKHGRGSAHADKRRIPVPHCRAPASDVRLPAYSAAAARFLCLSWLIA